MKNQREADWMTPRMWDEEVEAHRRRMKANRREERQVWHEFKLGLNSVERASLEAAERRDFNGRAVLWALAALVLFLFIAGLSR